MTYIIRAATLADEPAVSAILAASYSTLLAPHYAKDVLDRTLPYMNKASPKLLGCGTYYVAENGQGDLIGCGGWTPERPGTVDIIPGEAYVRHFGTHPDWTRKGVGRAIMDRCCTEAATQGVTRLHCYVTLPAERFYQALGFKTIEPMDFQMRKDVVLPSVLMLCEIKVS
jgi:N-acetylglutamate synthase-like GNAT family acetyltransferase